MNANESALTLPVFFSKRMVADSASYSPSAGKPSLVVESWKRLGLPLEFMGPQPVTVAEFSLAHDEKFVRAVLERKADNGFGNRSSEVAASLPYTSGSMLSAARHALKKGGAAVAPCSGFHHASYAHVSGFCTFNGLMVTAAVLHQEGAQRIGILDCDHHEGDGTDHIIQHLGANKWVRHFTAGRHYSAPSDAKKFFQRLPSVLDQFADCDVVLYQAGADPHINDPLGGWLTTAQLLERDRVVFQTLADMKLPVAWNLAGGYQREADGTIPKVLEIHDNTMRACAESFLRRDAPREVEADQRL